MHRVRIQHNSMQGIIITLFAFVVCVALFFVVFGTRSYSAVVNARNAANRSRASFSFITTQLRSVSDPSAVTRRDGPEGPVLVLSEKNGQSVYETRIYCYQGALVQEYVKDVTPLSPGTARTVASVDSFDFSEDSYGLLHVVIDGEEHVVLLRDGVSS